MRGETPKIKKKYWLFTIYMLETKIIKEWEETAKNDAKRFFKEKDISIADYAKKLLEYYFGEERKARFANRGVDEAGINARAEVYNEAFWKSYAWWQRKNAENEKVLAKYEPIFKEAEAVANAVDVSDIKDGFPCGWVYIYLKDEKSELGKALRSIKGGDAYSAKVCYWSTYQLPVKLPNYGQCVSFDERVSQKVVEFLKEKGIEAGTHTCID